MPSRPPSRDARCEMALGLVRSLNPRPPLASAPPGQSGHTSAPSALPPHPLLPVLLLLLPRPLSLALSPAAPLCSSRADRDCTHRSLRALSLSPRLLPVRGTGARRRRAASDARSSPFCVEQLGRTGLFALRICSRQCCDWRSRGRPSRPPLAALAFALLPLAPLALLASAHHQQCRMRVSSPMQPRSRPSSSVRLDPAFPPSRVEHLQLSLLAQT